MDGFLNRMTIAALLIAVGSTGSRTASAQSRLVRTTVSYREVDGHEILVDVHRPEGDHLHPVLVWIHGGALIMGHRAGIHPQVRAVAEDHGYALVSIDYRLAPETKLPELIGDVEAAFQWLVSKGAKRFHLDRDRIVVSGGSAGGYLSLVTGFRIRPRPKAIVALYGYGDLTGDWYATPSPHPRHNPRKISAAEVARQTDGTVVSDARRRRGNGSIIYLYYRQNGIWPREVSGFEDATAEKMAPFEPVRNVTPDYPPTLLIHGTKDTDVPFAQSATMSKQLSQHGVPVVLIPIRNGEHGFKGADPKAIEDAYEAMREFIVKHLETK